MAEGSIFAFLGTNGAGKSTTISCITTVTPFDGGTILVAGLTVGRDDTAIRHQIGVVFQQSILDSELTVRENLTVRAGFYGISGRERRERIAELSGLVALDDFLDRPYGQLSGGQKRRADIARALVHRPRILFLDEPTAGLDPQSREQVWTTIHALNKNVGLTVFLTTHYMEETEEADRVCVIDRGEIVAEGTPGQLRREYSRSILSITPVPGSTERITAALASWGMECEAGEVLRITVENSMQSRHILAALGEDVADFEFRHGTMDDVFLALTGTGVTE
ncbi:ABC transporter ATP-binding protein [Mycetocola spongiae]|uniref:ABC transporter ATP-binding protein n=1 Tax=Mycetocola spongiae TaxID=2859226 RepID=UPI0021F3D243|nr:ATP-binding cassette domain-containing protein [Mycetocola spongiae]